MGSQPLLPQNMPRQSRSRSSAPAPKRAAVPAQTAQPQRQASGVPATQQAQAGGQPSFLGGIAQTAAGVAVGSTVGHGLSSMLFGGSSAPQQVEAPATNAASMEAPACSIQAKDFTQCLNASGNDFNACSFYLDQLKACQAAAQEFR